MGFNATFQPNGNASPFTKASFLQKKSVRAIVRFSHSPPSPNTTEWIIPIKGMAVQFQSDGDSPVSLVMVNAPIFPTKTPEAFMRLIETIGNGKGSVKERFAAIRDDLEFSAVPTMLKQLKTPTSFATARFWALHAYMIYTDSIAPQAVRFSWEPVSTARFLGLPPTDFESELLKRHTDSPVQFRLLMTLGAPEDPTHDPSIMWPDDRVVIDVGTLTLTTLRPDQAESILFDPTIEQPGFSCSDDPVLHFRSSVYAESYQRRSSECPNP